MESVDESAGDPEGCGGGDGDPDRRGEVRTRDPHHDPEDDGNDDDQRCVGSLHPHSDHQFSLEKLEENFLSGTRAGEPRNRV